MTFTEALAALLAELRLKGYSAKTRINYADQLKRFGEWLDDDLAAELRRVSCADIDTYQRYVQAEPIGAETKALRLRAVKRLFDYLTASGALLLHPAEHVVEIRRKARLPRSVLTVKQVEALLGAPDTATPLGLRDRALLEVLYGTAIRVGELEQVRLADLDLGGETLHIRHGKGGRERVVPLGKRCAEWLRRYLEAVRTVLARHRPFEPALFLVQSGRPLVQTQIRAILRGYRRRCGLKRPVTPHALRHACATHLLQAGADVRLIQELLGHARIDSTALYTRVAPGDVKTVHARYHPWEAAGGAR